MDEKPHWVHITCQRCGWGICINPKTVKAKESVKCEACGDEFHIFPAEDGESIISDRVCYDRPIKLTVGKASFYL